MSYVQCTCTCAMYGHYAHDPRTRVNSFIDRFYSGFGAHGYSEYFQKSSEIIARKKKLLHTWEWKTHGRNSWCINIFYCALCIYTLQTCSIYVTTMLSINTQYNLLMFTPQCTAFAYYYWWCSGKQFFFLIYIKMSVVNLLSNHTCLVPRTLHPKRSCPHLQSPQSSWWGLVLGKTCPPV